MRASAHAGHLGATAAPASAAPPSAAGGPAAPAEGGHGAHAGHGAPAGSAATAASDPRASAVAGATVRMFSDRFTPEVLTVPVGTTVTRLMDDGVGQTHAVVGPGFESPDMHVNEAWQHTFDTVGVFEYECPHPIDMIGVIRVVPADAAP